MRTRVILLAVLAASTVHAQVSLGPAVQASGAGGAPGGSAGQLQYNNSGAFGGADLSGDCTTSGNLAVTCTKTNGNAFTALAYTSASGGITASMLASGTALNNLAANSITSAYMAQAAPNTVRGNATGLTANIQDVSIPPSCSGTGNYLQRVAGGGFTCVSPVAALAVRPGNPSSTSSTSLIMAGIGGVATITPNATGRLQITVSGSFYTASAAAGMNIIAYYGTGTSPNFGSAVTGTQIGSSLAVRAGGAGSTIGSPFSINYIVTGLTVGTPIWIDLGFDTTNAADAANLQSLMVTAVEF